MDASVIFFVVSAFAAGLGAGLLVLRGARAAGALEARSAGEAERVALREQVRSRDAQAVDVRAQLAEAKARGDADAADARTLAARLAGVEAELAAERRAAVARAEEAERSREQVRAEIQVLAARLLDEKGRVMLERSREGLEALLAPVAARLKEFEAKVERTYDTESRDRASLLGSLRRLQETQERLHDDAEALARALTGESKVQGDWGELVLERVLETAGLAEGREYGLQVSHVDDDGGLKRPDAVVYLPGDRAIVVDAKCSLTAFVEATRALDAAVREAALDRHVESVRKHVKELAAKRYPEVLRQRTLDLVLLFVPNEAAFHAAVARAPGLYDEAFRHRIVICSPTTLLAALQLVAHVWRTEKQNANAQRIAEEAGKLLDKLGGFVADLDDVGARLGLAQRSFAAAREKLATGRGNVLGKAAAIAKLGARVRSDKLEDLLLEASGAEGEAEEEAALAGPLPPGRSGGAAPVA